MARLVPRLPSLLRLGAQGAEPLASLPEHTGILVLMGRPLALSELAPLADRLAEPPVVMTPFSVAGVEVLVLLTSGFDEALGEWLKAQTWSLDAAYVRALPDLAEPGLLLMDMDSTAIQIECIDEIAWPGWGSRWPPSPPPPCRASWSSATACATGSPC